MPARSLTNASDAPSGDQAGERSLDAVLVRFEVECPIEFVTQMSSFPLRLLMNAIVSSFGDHAGSKSSAASAGSPSAGCVARCLWKEPSAFMIQRSRSGPLRAL